MKESIIKNYVFAMICCLCCSSFGMNMDLSTLKNQMKKFETMINTADVDLANELVDPKAPFFTPAFPEPVYGGEGYLSLVFWLRKSFSNVQWKLEEMVAEDNKVAVHWTCSGTQDGEFMGIPATGKSFSASFMNFYAFNDQYKVISDTAAEGMIAILRALEMNP